MESPIIDKSIINLKPTSSRIRDIVPLIANSNNVANFDSPISLNSVTIQKQSSKRVRDIIADDYEPRNSAKRICSLNDVICD